MRSNLLVTLMISAVAIGCESNPLAVADQETGDASDLDEVQFVNGDAGFPVELDLAILIPLEADPYIRASTRADNGSALLSSSWVSTVGAGFNGTFAEGAIGGEAPPPTGRTP